MKTKFLPVAMVVLMGAGLVLPAAYAGKGKGDGNCPFEKGGKGGYSHGKSGDQGLDGMFFHKAHYLLSKKDEIGLSEDQVKSIKELKSEMKKAYLRQDAEIKILKMDIQSKLKSEKVDAAEVQQLIEKKYAAKESLAQNFLGAYLKLKGTLNDKQWEVVKGLKQEKR